LTADAVRVLEALRTRGASFTSDLRKLCGLDADAARYAVGVLVATGLAASDGFSGLRALIWSKPGLPASRDRRASFAGRWTSLNAPKTDEGRSEAIEAQAWSLLRRYGVIFRRLLTREPTAAPWRELARVYRRLEARGEIRSGRFVTGMSGEQFAMPRAVERLREVRRTPRDGRLLTISTADPLNLVGIVTAGERIRAATRNRLVYRDGVPLAVLEGDEVRELTTIDSAIAADVSQALTRRRPLAFR
jgi:ATP-dependent Lhr-like helicase